MRPLAIVAVGRNEGERLSVCLRSALKQASCVVYVDSESTDGSAALAASLGAGVVRLDSCTVSMARNAGFEQALSNNPQLVAIQFVDGDCELVDGWIARAERELERPDVGVVFGRRRERFPDKSIYIRLSDFGWEAPFGFVDACGGDALMRVSAFKQAGGFDPALIAGEEADLCLRLRRKGWKILCIDAPMTLHDIGITSFQEWWKRSVRTGHGYAQGAWQHGLAPEHHWLRETLSIWFWGALLPLTAVVLLWIAPLFAILIAAAYLLLILRIYVRTRQRFRPAFAYAIFCVIGKLPQLIGQCRFHLERCSGRQQHFMEYKSERKGQVR
jgi:GT2 family glycosyltransferase